MNLAECSEEEREEYFRLNSSIGEEFNRATENWDELRHKYSDNPIALGIIDTREKMWYGGGWIGSKKSERNIKIVVTVLTIGAIGILGSFFWTFLRAAFS